jgi:hypothetical protein
MALFNFDANEYSDFETNFDPVPEGEYEVMCEEAEEKNSQSGGVYIKAKFRVLGPTHANRVIFNNFNIVNRSDKAQEIGRRQLSTWARAVGKPNANDTDELLNRPCLAVVAVEAGDEKYGPQNRINGFKPKTGAASPNVQAIPKPAVKEPVTSQEAAPVQSKPAEPRPSSATAGSAKKAPWD